MKNVVWKVRWHVRTHGAGPCNAIPQGYQTFRTGKRVMGWLVRRIFPPTERTLLPPLFLGCSERYLARSHQILLRGGSCRLRDDDDDDEGMPL